MSYRGRLTNQNFDSVEAMRHAETREAMRRDVPTAEEIALENMPLDDLKAVCNRMARSDAEKAALASEGGQSFVFSIKLCFPRAEATAQRFVQWKIPLRYTQINYVHGAPQ